MKAIILAVSLIFGTATANACEIVEWSGTNYYASTQRVTFEGVSSCRAGKFMVGFYRNNGNKFFKAVVMVVEDYVIRHMFESNVHKLPDSLSIRYKYIP